MWSVSVHGGPPKAEERDLKASFVSGGSRGSCDRVELLLQEEEMEEVW